MARVTRNLEHLGLTAAEAARFDVLRRAERICLALAYSGAGGLILVGIWWWRLRHA